MRQREQTARDLDKGDELKQIAGQHNNCHLVELDIADKDSINRARQEVQRLLGDRPIDVLLNNAATGMSSSDRASEAEPNTVDRILHTNIVGPMQVTQVFLPFLRRSLQPKVIFMSSSMGHPRHVRSNAVTGLGCLVETSFPHDQRFPLRFTRRRSTCPSNQ